MRRITLSGAEERGEGGGGIDRDNLKNMKVGDSSGRTHIKQRQSAPSSEQKRYA